REAHTAEAATFYEQNSTTVPNFAHRPVCITGENFRKAKAQAKMERLKMSLNRKESRKSDSYNLSVVT
ncbi:MAG: hypothetical protein K2I53_06340, partial [Lachnospiraceae bacterium]|nr:hypothetical protein [Lachnospiraceae bacterium]